MRGTGAPRPRFSGWEDVSSPSRFRIFACRKPKIGRQPKRIICSRRKSRLEILQRLLSISRLQSLGWRGKTYKSSKVLEVEDISIDLTHRMCCRSTRQRARGELHGRISHVSPLRRVASATLYPVHRALERALLLQITTQRVACVCSC